MNNQNTVKARIEPGDEIIALMVGLKSTCCKPMIILNLKTGKTELGEKWDFAWAEEAFKSLQTQLEHIRRLERQSEFPHYQERFIAMLEARL